MCKLETNQNKAKKEALDAARSSDEGTVKLVEEACWGSALSADGDAGGQFDKGCPDPDCQPVTVVEPAR